MKFKCPSCDMQLKAEPEHAGQVVRCPGCNTKLQIPEESSVPEPSIPAPSGMSKTPPPPSGTQSGAASSGSKAPSQKTPAKKTRTGWEETDPTNPNLWLTAGIGVGVTIVFLVVLMMLAPPAGMPSSDYSIVQYTASLWKSQFAINGFNTLFFFWAITILVFKWRKLVLQRRALLLDVLPQELGAEINADNVGKFIDNLYELPERLRDSIMVNRIRKALELFESRQNSGNVVHLMTTQSDIDAARISISFAFVKAFLWAIPILGFAGTVIGLSQALMSLNFDNLEDVSAITESLQGVIGGLGGAFDSTLVGLVLVLILNFPMHATIKAEDDNLSGIDTFCNEVLIPRLNDGSGVAGGDEAAVMDHLVKAVAAAQQEFLEDLNILSATVVEQAANLEQRAIEHQQKVSAEFAFTLDRMREDLTAAIANSVEQTTDHTKALATGIGSLNEVLKDLGEKQVVIQQTVKKGWFSRK